MRRKRSTMGGKVQRVLRNRSMKKKRMRKMIGNSRSSWKRGGRWKKKKGKNS